MPLIPICKCTATIWRQFHRSMHCHYIKFQQTLSIPHFVSFRSYVSVSPICECNLPLSRRVCVFAVCLQSTKLHLTFQCIEMCRSISGGVYLDLIKIRTDRHANAKLSHFTMARRSCIRFRLFHLI